MPTHKLNRLIAPLFASPVQRTIAECLEVIEEQLGFGTFTVERFRDWITEVHQRPILCEPLAMDPRFSGAWVRTPVVDLVFYEERTTPLHQAHIQLHELCHILLMHDTFTVQSQGELGYVRDVLIHGSKASLQEGERPLRLRSVPTDAQELEAEGLASQLHQRVLRTQMAPVTGRDVTSSDALVRMYRSMGWM
jgi:hypothetical protein